jgi:hypothetical protein
VLTRGLPNFIQHLSLIFSIATPHKINKYLLWLPWRMAMVFPYFCTSGDLALAF